MAAGDGEEHVVEVWRVDRQPLDVDAGAVHLVKQLAERVDRAIRGDLEDELVIVRSGAGEQVRRGAQQVRVGEMKLHVTARDAALQLRGGAFGDDLALIEHSDPVRELVSLVKVLGGEQHRHARGGEISGRYLAPYLSSQVGDAADVMPQGEHAIPIKTVLDPVTLDKQRS